jgi:hypothetical protein
LGRVWIIVVLPAIAKEMTDYRRLKTPGATWFFTVNLAQRRGNHLLADQVDRLRGAIRKVKTAHPFAIGCGSFGTTLNSLETAS